MVGVGEKFVGGVYFVGEGVNIDFLFEGIVSASTTLRSRQGHAAAGQCEGDNHCVDHFDLGTLEEVSKMGTPLVVVCVEHKELAGEYLEPPSGLWQANGPACPGRGGGGVLPIQNYHTSQN
jgi:hypothetical protein